MTGYRFRFIAALPYGLPEGFNAKTFAQPAGKNFTCGL
jgi:hypothetical protein